MRPRISWELKAIVLGRHILQLSTWRPYKKSSFAQKNPKLFISLFFYEHVDCCDGKRV